MSKFYSSDSDTNLSDKKAQEAGSTRLVAVALPASCEPNQPINILRLPDVMKRVGLCRASIYLHMGRGYFPRSISLGPRAIGWLEHEIDAWLLAKVSKRTETKN